MRYTNPRTHSLTRRGVLVGVLSPRIVLGNESVPKIIINKKGKGSPCSITERRVPKPIPVLGSQPAGDVSHKPGGRLRYFSPGLQLPPQPLRRLLPISLLAEHNGCEQFA